MINKFFLLLLFIILCGRSLSAQALESLKCDMKELQGEITTALSKDFNNRSHEHPLLILIGGYPGAGKTTLIRALSDTQDLVVISWNAIRQLLLDRGVKDSPPFDWGVIIEDVTHNLLRICFERQLNIVIDANAHTRTIREIESFLKKENQSQIYKVVKICLNPPIETLFERLHARVQKEGVHQGTPSDLQRDLNSSKKKIEINDYALIINSDEIPFETELKIVKYYLENLIQR